MLTQEQIEQAVQDSLPSILRGLKEQLEEKAIQEAGQVVSGIVRGVVQEWVKEQIIPVLTATLVEHKEGIIAVAPKLASMTTELLVEAMIVDLKKSLENSWDRRKILKAMFGE